ncbi:MAG: ATP-binding protein [Vulcanimicrobiota bacterium]
MSLNDATSVIDTLDNLIEQFTDPFAFYRELIQNSLDAGTNRIDIFIEFIPDEKKEGQGVMIIHVDDYGEGMNREVIDSQLTRLFSSSKENDLTKIGKFGIGFVSVFAIKPDAIIIDTSKDGQDWRIIFNADKSFERMKRDFPVDGTKIQVIKTCTEKFYNESLSRSSETINYWCRHSEAEIYFQDNKVNKPFDLKSPVKIHVNENTGEIVAGYTLEDPPFYGFYNQGLTLVEGRSQHFANVAFKIKSKYLEHTLTRDNIRQDTHYWKAIDLLKKIVLEELPFSLFEEMEKQRLNHPNETERYKELIEYLPRFIYNPDTIPKKCLDKAIALDINKSPITLKEIRKIILDKTVFYDESPNIITQQLANENYKIILAEPSSELISVLDKIGRALFNETIVLKASAVYFKPEVVKRDKLSKEQKEIIREVSQLNKKMNVKISSPVFANFDYPESIIADKIYVMQEKPGSMSHISELENKENLLASLFSLFKKSKTLVLNINNPYVKGLMQLAKTDLNLSAYLLTKLLYIDDGIETETDIKLINYTLERRS